MNKLLRKLNNLSVVLMACVICLDLYSGVLKLVPFWITPSLLIVINVSLVLTTLISKKITLNSNSACLSILIAIMILSMIINNKIYVMSVLRLTTIMLFFICYQPSEKSLRVAALIILIFGLVQAFGVFFEAFFFDRWFSFVENMFSDAIPDLYYKLVTAQKRIGYLSGFTHNAGFTATYLINGIIAWFIIYRKKSNILDRICLLILFIALIMTGKRGQLLLIIIAFMIAFIIKDKNINKIFRRIVVISIILVVLYFIGDYLYLNLKDEGSLQRILKLIYENTNHDKTSGRTILWKQAIDGFISNPFFGKGWLSFEYKYGLEVHNTYLQYLYETGIFGLAFFIIYILNSILLFRRQVRYSICKNINIFNNPAWLSLVYSVYFALFSLIENSMVNIEPLMFMAIVFKYGTLYGKIKKENIHLTS